MPKYEVVVKEIEIYHFDEIEAESETDAINKAYELLDENTKEEYFSDSDGEAEAYEI